MINLGAYDEAVRVLAATNVLPSENARESHLLYELAHVGAALDDLDAGAHGEARAHLEAALMWPESLGQGRPFDPDERLVRFLLGVVARAAGDESVAREAFEAVVARATGPADRPVGPGDVLAIAALHALGRDPGQSVRDALVRGRTENRGLFASPDWMHLDRVLSASAGEPGRR